MTAKVNAYMFTVNAAAWKQFCEELAIAPDQLVATYHDGYLLPLAFERMPSMAPTRDELIDLFRKRGHEDPKPVTVDTLLSRWRKSFHEGTPCDLRPAEGHKHRPTVSTTDQRRGCATSVAGIATG